MVTLLNSIANIIGGNMYDNIRNMIFTLMMHKIFIGASKIMRKMTTTLIWIW